VFGQTNKRLAGLTPSKLILIVVLFAILLIVIAVQFSNSSPRGLAVDKTRSPTPAADSLAPGPATQRIPVKPVALWPQITRAEALLHDPFQLPQLLRSEVGRGQRDDQEEDTGSFAAELSRHRRQLARIASFRSRGVDMVLVTAQGRVARLGELSVREGDLVEGFRVVKIHSRGIVLAADAGEESRDGVASDFMTSSSKVLGWLKGQLLDLSDEASTVSNTGE
jgi:hypothetical protein